ncbi:MAG: hypothetical protein CM1200mP30_29240 [Pseudomonadota bacterium]|nr:MAG: hypothetical protein CM1200mP30_29240 [Pseudomonadota bacterium]
MVLIKPGKFKMGSDDGLPSERPVHQVKVGEFWIDKCEITNYQYLQVVAQHPFLGKAPSPENITMEII